VLVVIASGDLQFYGGLPVSSVTTVTTASASASASVSSTTVIIVITASVSSTTTPAAAASTATSAAPPSVSTVLSIIPGSLHISQNIGCIRSIKRIIQKLLKIMIRPAIISVRIDGSYPFSIYDLPIRLDHFSARINHHSIPFTSRFSFLGLLLVSFVRGDIGCFCRCIWQPFSTIRLYHIRPYSPFRKDLI